MGLRSLLISSAVVALVFGGMFLFATNVAIAQFQLGEGNVPALLFGRNFGLALIAFAVMNLLSLRDEGSPALQALLLGNLLLHLVSPLIDFSESFPMSGGRIIGLAVHVLFVVWFGYHLLRLRRRA